MDVKVLAAIVTAVATILAFLLNIGFTHFVLPKLQSKRSRKDIVDKFGYPLTRAVGSNVAYLSMFLENRDKGWVLSKEDDYFRLSLLYTFGEFLGWWRLIETNAYLEFSDPSSNRRSLYHQGLKVFKSMNSLGYFSPLSKEDAAVIAGSTIPRRAAQAIGEIMIDDAEGSDLINFSKFCELYESDPKFQKWFGYLLRPFEKIESCEDTYSLERVELILCAFEVFQRSLLYLIGVMNSKGNDLELLSHKNIRSSVKESFLHDYQKEEFKILMSAHRAR